MAFLDIGARLLQKLPPETAHRASLGLLRVCEPLLPAPPADDPRLHIAALGLRFPNPIGLAAGFDKNAQASDAMAKFGFGFVECGTVTPRPQEGNPRPRLFRLQQDRAVINRMGFNNAGCIAVARNLKRRRGHGIVGINIGANKQSLDRIADYVQCYRVLAGLANYVVINVSSPNTEGLRGLQNRDALQRLLEAMMGARAEGPYVPLLLKIAPDLDRTSLDDIAEVVRGSSIEGLIISNTTVTRPPLKSRYASQTGGLSGIPLFDLSTAVLSHMYARLGRSITFIGVGGIASGKDAYAKIRAGASLLQLYSALVYQGPQVVSRIKQELLDCLTRDGFSSLAPAIGSGPAPVAQI